MAVKLCCEITSEHLVFGFYYFSLGICFLDSFVALQEDACEICIAICRRDQIKERKNQLLSNALQDLCMLSCYREAA